MKKIIMAVTASAALVLTGCGSSGGSNQESNEPQYEVQCMPGMSQSECENLKDYASRINEDGTYDMGDPADTDSSNEEPTKTEDSVSSDEGYVPPEEDPTDMCSADLSDEECERLVELVGGEDSDDKATAMGDIVEYDDGIEVSLDYSQPFVDDGNRSCGASDGTSYGLVVVNNITNTGKTDGLNTANDLRIAPEVRYFDASGESVVAKPLSRGFDKGEDASRFWKSIYYEDINIDNRLRDIVEIGESWQYNFAYCLVNTVDPDTNGIEAYFTGDKNDARWVSY